MSVPGSMDSLAGGNASLAMARRFALAFLLLAALIAVPSVRAAANFDYYLLELMWPGAYCSQTNAGCCKPTTGYPAIDFFVSSFATYNETTNRPVTKCNRTPFYVNELAALNEDLTAYWSSIRCPSNNGLSAWKNAWKSHGVCSDLEESEYFRAALKARASANVLQILLDNGIVPGNCLYSLETVKNAIKKKLGVTPGIQCSKSPYNIEGLFQIYRIYLCFNSDGAIRDCPLTFNFTCSSYVQFKPFDYSQLKTSSADALDGSNPILMPA